MTADHSNRNHIGNFCRLAGRVAFLLGIVTLNGPARGQSPSGPLALKAAAEEALANNPGIQAQRHRVTASETGSKQASSAYKPRFDFEEVFTNGDDPVYVFGSLLRQGEFGPRNFDPATLNNPEPLNNFNHRLSVSQLIYDGGRREKQVSLSKQGIESNREALRSAEQRLLHRLIGSYYRVLLADESVRVARDALRTAEAHQQRARDREAVGMAVKSDVMRLEVQTADYRRAVLSAESDLRTARRELETLLGREPVGAVALSGKLVEREFAAPGSLELRSKALSQHPELKQAALGAQMAGEKARLARGSFYPSVGFLGYYDFNNGTSTGLGNQYLLAVRLQFNLYDGGQKSAALDQARAEGQAAEQMRRQAEQQLQLQVSSAFDRQQVALEQHRVARKAVELAQEGLRIVQDRQAEGLASVTDLLSAQTALYQSQLSALHSLYAYHMEYASLELASGTLGLQSPLFAAAP